MDQNCAPGNWLIASVKIMNARPVPDADCKVLHKRTINYSYNSVISDYNMFSSGFTTDCAFEMGI